MVGPSRLHRLSVLVGLGRAALVGLERIALERIALERVALERIALGRLAVGWIARGRLGLGWSERWRWRRAWQSRLPQHDGAGCGGERAAGSVCEPLDQQCPPLTGQYEPAETDPGRVAGCSQERAKRRSEQDAGAQSAGFARSASLARSDGRCVASQSRCSWDRTAARWTAVGAGGAGDAGRYVDRDARRRAPGWTGRVVGVVPSAVEQLRGAVSALDEPHPRADAATGAEGRGGWLGVYGPAWSRWGVGAGRSLERRRAPGWTGRVVGADPSAV
jgi:hypothetical protein